MSVTAYPAENDSDDYELAGVRKVERAEKKRPSFDWLMIIVYPIMLIQGICAAIFLGTFKVLAALSDWINNRSSYGR